jgi:hypothetical protein
MTRRPNVSLIWCGNDQITEAGSDLDAEQLLEFLQMRR